MVIGGDYRNIDPPDTEPPTETLLGAADGVYEPPNPAYPPAVDAPA
jgi:hypothetical protein